MFEMDMLTENRRYVSCLLVRWALVFVMYQQGRQNGLGSIAITLRKRSGLPFIALLIIF
jgi:hypothetical protein